jgi:hypothetical protein
MMQKCRFPLLLVIALASNPVWADVTQTLCRGLFVSNEFFDSLDDVPWVPRNWRELTVGDVIHDYPHPPKERFLNRTIPGTWWKVYRTFRDGRELHYFWNEDTEHVYQVK